MKLMDLMDEYIAWRRHHGAKFESSERELRRFGRQVGTDADISAVCREDILSYLAGKGPLTATRTLRYGALAGLYDYAISRGHVAASPLPTRESEPPKPQTRPPHVYSREELECLFGAIDTSRKRAVQLDADTFRVFLLLLYGAGLRFGEALRLTLGDVNLEEATLTIRDTKFYKTRLVPVGTQLNEVLRRQARRRRSQSLPEGDTAIFLAGRDGTPLIPVTVTGAFYKLLRAADIRQDRDGGRRPPNLHSLRHTAAVHRVESWYRQGLDVQRMLPALATWLGHADLNGTQVYLTMTPALLRQASIRFEQYCSGGQDD